MLKVIPCQPTIGKVDQVLNGVFKPSRLFGTFPIDSEYSGISKYNFAKGVVLYVLVSIIATASVSIQSHDDQILMHKVRFILQTIPNIIFHLTNLVSLLGNRRLVKKLYDELKDIQYQLWKNNIDWFYKPSWYLQYAGFIAALITNLIFEILYTRWQNIEIRFPYYITYVSLYSITSQYLALLQLCLSILRHVKTIQESGTVIKLTDKVLALCQKVNTLYEAQLLAYISNIFFVLLIVIYFKTILGETFNAITVWWIVSLVSPLLLITLCTGYISQEVKNINKMLYRRLLYNLDDEMLYFHLVAKRDIVFTAHGFFNLKNNLIFSMITTGINYLIFLIQYM
ncbi:Gustatory receptor 118c [Halyomorpha halys]|nr:Gustatory receptor 118c [Halyomorpha halys]